MSIFFLIYDDDDIYLRNLIHFDPTHNTQQRRTKRNETNEGLVFSLFFNFFTIKTAYLKSGHLRKKT